MQLRETIVGRRRHLVEFFGGLIIVLIWGCVTELGLVPRGILPSPLAVLKSFYDLFVQDNLISHMWYSFSLNTYGLIEAVIISIPIGYAIGLDPITKAVFERYTTVIRFLPLTAITGIFIAWFGIGNMMKIQFLAFSIFVYLVPAIIQRINEVPEVYMQTVETLGASKWQTIRYVFLPGVLSAAYVDMRMLAALSWTYVVVVELVNTNDGGVGALSYLATRQSRIDKVFAVLIIIMLIGFAQDYVLKFIGKKLFPHNRGEQK